MDSCAIQVDEMDEVLGLYIFNGQGYAAYGI